MKSKALLGHQPSRSHGLQCRPAGKLSCEGPRLVRCDIASEVPIATSKELVSWVWSNRPQPTFIQKSSEEEPGALSFMTQIESSHTTN